MTTTAGTHLAAIRYEAGFSIDDFLARIAGILRAEQVRLGGALQENAPGGDTRCVAMSLVDLATRKRFRISQDLGSQAEGCRLDAQGLAEFVVLFDGALQDNFELLILNRFGKAEAEGGGLRPVFARAMEANIPVLTAVRAPYDEAWARFHGRLANDLPADIDAALAWCRDAVRQARAARPAQMSHAD